MPTLSHLTLRGTQFNEISVGDLMELQSGFTFLIELEVDIPGLLGSSAVKNLEYLPSISVLNGVNRSSIIEHGKHVIGQGSSFSIHAGGETGIGCKELLRFSACMVVRLRHSCICPEGSVAAMKVGEPSVDNCFSDREFKIIQVT